MSAYDLIERRVREVAYWRKETRELTSQPKTRKEAWFYIGNRSGEPGTFGVMVHYYADCWRLTWWHEVDPLWIDVYIHVGPLMFIANYWRKGEQ